MRTIATLAWLCTCMATRAQSHLCDLLPTNHQRVSYQEWVDADTVSKDSLYIRALRWMRSSDVMVDTLPRYTNGRAGVVVGDALLHVPDPHSITPLPVAYTITITAVDGRYQYALGDFYVRHQGDGVDGHTGVSTTPLMVWAASNVAAGGLVCAAIDRHAREVVGALTAFMALRHH